MLLNKAIQAVREVWQRMITKQDIKQMLGVDITISSSMTEALKLWDDMYCDVPPWANDCLLYTSPSPRD